MKLISVAFFVFFSINCTNAQQSDKKIDTILDVVNTISKQIEQNNLNEKKLVELNEKLKTDSQEIFEKESKISQLKTDIEKLKADKLTAEKNGKEAETDLSKFKEKQINQLENEIELLIRLGASNDSALLQSLQIRCEELKPKNKNKLLNLIAVCDSIKSIKKIFESPYEADRVRNGKERLNTLQIKIDKDLSSAFKKDFDNLKSQLEEYCENTNELYKVFAKAYPLRNDDKNVINESSKRNAFRSELNKSYYYIVNYKYLKSLFNDFLFNSSTQTQYQKKDLIPCNN